MYCGDASTSGNHLTQRIESACGETRDGNRWNAYRRAQSQVFLLRRAIELLPAFVRRNVHPLTAATFGDRLSPWARAHYHKSQINIVRSNDNNILIRLWWNLDYSTMGSSQSSKGKVPVFFHLRHIYVYRATATITNYCHFENTNSQKWILSITNQIRINYYKLLWFWTFEISNDKFCQQPIELK